MHPRRKWIDERLTEIEDARFGRPSRILSEAAFREGSASMTEVERAYRCMNGGKPESDGKEIDYVAMLTELKVGLPDEAYQAVLEVSAVEECERELRVLYPSRPVPQPVPPMVAVNFVLPLISYSNRYGSFPMPKR